MKYIGISAGFHDASLSVINDNGNLLFAGQNERYSHIKHDKDIGLELVQDAMKYVDGEYELHYYERPYLKYLRQLYAGQSPGLSSLFPRTHMSRSVNKILKGKINTHSHHLCHAAAGFQTSPFQESVIVIVDSIGEFDTISIWYAYYDGNHKAKYKKLYSKKYPNSLGLFYSALTQRVGLKPNEEEYITMGMAAYGEDQYYGQMWGDFVENGYDLEFKENLHVGFSDNYLPNADLMDLACSGQMVLECLLHNVFVRAKALTGSDNLVYGGGVALNCLANRITGVDFRNTWIFPNPGDAGSSVGAAALGYGKRVNFNTCFLGHSIEGNYPVDRALDCLLRDRIVGIASGKAEFGPRALGNRSLLADPRGSDIKDKVNEIKRRQKFRPFAPVILEEYANNYFVMPRGWDNSRYMQTVASCRNPELFPAIVHHDNTSRVQTVPKDGSGIRELLEKWYVLTECPMLLNTSLNIRGEPMVNNIDDAKRFETLYGIKVLS